MSIKTLVICVLVTLISISAMQAQILEPVKWSATVKKISNTEYDLIAKATIDKGWHLYAQNIQEDGPIATTFTFEEDPAFKIVGNTLEEKGRTVMDAVFNMQIKYFENQIEFRQRIKVLNTEFITIIAEVEFMACNDKQCTAPSYAELIYNLEK